MRKQRPTRHLAEPFHILSYDGLSGVKQTSGVATRMSAYDPSPDMGARQFWAMVTTGFAIGFIVAFMILHFRGGAFAPRSFLKIKIENFRALFWARSFNRFFQRAFPLLRLHILSGFQCRIRYAKFAMLQTSEPHAVKGAGLNFLCLRFANWTYHHRQLP